MKAIINGIEIEGTPEEVINIIKELSGNNQGINQPAQEKPKKNINILKERYEEINQYWAKNPHLSFFKAFKKVIGYAPNGTNYSEYNNFFSNTVKIKKRRLRRDINYDRYKAIKEYWEQNPYLSFSQAFHHIAGRQTGTNDYTTYAKIYGLQKPEVMSAKSSHYGLPPNLPKMRNATAEKWRLIYEEHKRMPNKSFSELFQKYFKRYSNGKEKKIGCELLKIPDTRAKTKKYKHTNPNYMHRRKSSIVGKRAFVLQKQGFNQSDAWRIAHAEAAQNKISYEVPKEVLKPESNDFVLKSITQDTLCFCGALLKDTGKLIKIIDNGQNKVLMECSECGTKTQIINKVR